MIYDRDHGIANEGWFVRMTTNYGTELDYTVRYRGHTMSQSTARRHLRQIAAYHGADVRRGLVVEVKP
ncbi:MAG: hypothetical protein EBR82_22445 [Caulobacteraceae bacterium]|nr:hypothetical protein [Caulobacteraceae bacterium]